MANFKQQLTDDLSRFINKQLIFFTGSAVERGRVNVSPKGMDSFRVLDPKTVAYLDYTGSGNETAAHLQNGGRLTIMFCSFTAKPLILRLYGRGEVVLPTDARFAELIQRFPRGAGERQIILFNIESLQTSCGWGVPVMHNAEVRPTMIEWAEKKGENGLANYREKNNRQSIDGLPVTIP